MTGKRMTVTLKMSPN